MERQHYPRYIVIVLMLIAATAWLRISLARLFLLRLRSDVGSCCHMSSSRLATAAASTSQVVKDLEASLRCAKSKFRCDVRGQPY